MEPQQQQQSWPYFDPDYETLSARITPPRVVVDNTTCENATLIKVDSVNTHGILLEVVQMLTELDLCICKAYISTDGGWFMDVFHVTDQMNKKLTDDATIEFIKQSLGAHQDHSRGSQVRKAFNKTVGVNSAAEHTAIELTGTDRPGLLSDISAVLARLGCNVKHAEVWTHKLHVACVVYVTEEKIGAAVEDPEKLRRIREELCEAMKGDDQTASTTLFSKGASNTERRLHQMMAEDRYYDEDEVVGESEDGGGEPDINIETCKEKGYSIVIVESSDRPKLLFDTVCTLTDMQYVVFHAAITSENGFAHQEYYIRNLDGRFLDSEAEKQRLIRGLKAAIERRVLDGLRLEVCTADKVGLLSEVTQKLRENGLSVMRAGVETKNKKAVNVLYVTDTAGKPVDRRIVESIQKVMSIGHTTCSVEEIPRLSRASPDEPAKGWKSFSLETLLKSQSERFLFGLFLFGLSNLGWARSLYTP